MFRMPPNPPEHTMTIRHTLIAALATAALISPAAQAQSPDMHASTAEAAAKARALTPATEGGGGPWSEQDQRSPVGRPTRQTDPTTPSASDDGSPVPALPIV